MSHDLPDLSDSDSSTDTEPLPFSTPLKLASTEITKDSDSSDNEITFKMSRGGSPAKKDDGANDAPGQQVPVQVPKISELLPERYDGTGNAESHWCLFNSYLRHQVLRFPTLPTKIAAFQMCLSGDAVLWFEDLDTTNYVSLNDLRDAFYDRFREAETQTVLLKRLQAIKYKTGENVHALYQKFKRLADKLNLTADQRSVRLRLMFPQQLRLFITSNADVADLDSIIRSVQEYEEIMSPDSDETNLLGSFASVSISDDDEQIQCQYCEQFGHDYSTCKSHKIDMANGAIKKFKVKSNIRSTSPSPRSGRGRNRSRSPARSDRDNRMRGQGSRRRSFSPNWVPYREPFYRVGNQQASRGYSPRYNARPFIERRVQGSNQMSGVRSFSPNRVSYRETQVARGYGSRFNTRPFNERRFQGSNQRSNYRDGNSAYGNHFR